MPLESLNKNLVRKEVATSYNHYSFSHVAVFAPKERSIKLFINLQKIEQTRQAADFIVTISDINNRCIRLSPKSTDAFKTKELLISYTLDTDILQPPFRVEIIHKYENENFKSLKVKVWYMAQEAKNKGKRTFNRLGKFFPGLSRG